MPLPCFTVRPALQALFSCLACVALLKRPVVCVPCGHCYCHACLMASERDGHLTCPECNHLPVQRWVPDRWGWCLLKLLGVTVL